MTKNEFNLLYTIKKQGMQSYRQLSSFCGLSIGYISETVNSFKQQGYIDEKGITEKGISALSPYKVNNAVIMAAGMSSRFVPLSIEKPKGLLEVKGEVLIERQIKQLKEAGIDDIIVVLGYKKEAFFYLEEQFGVKIIINPSYNIKNNVETLYLVREHLGNTYICSSDNYFAENVFEDYVYNSYYSAVHVYEKSSEWYMIPDSKGNVAGVNKFGEEGSVMLGHVFFDKDFSAEFVKLLEKHHDLGDYDDRLWEDLFSDNIKKLPPMEIKEYHDDVIFEFDSLDELRKFDDKYVNNTRSKILHNITTVLNCKESDITDFKPIKEGLTNTSFVFCVKGKKYVYRHPGDGTEAIINRSREKVALELAKSVGVDPTFLYMNDKEGWKISLFIDNIRTPKYESFEDCKRLIAVMRQLHDKKLSVDWSFDPWGDLCEMERITRSKGEINVKGYDELRAKVEKCYKKTVGDGIEPCFCHCDTYAPNWMFNDTDAILIDWEYAANADPGCDIGCFIMDSMYEVDQSIRFIKEYCGEDCTDAQLYHYLAYVAVVSFYWFVWALYREACGAVMGEVLHKWYVMAVRYANYLTEEYKL